MGWMIWTEKIGIGMSSMPLKMLKAVCVWATKDSAWCQ